MNLFDCCVITASDERQAGVFRALIQRRVESSLYPREITFVACADPPGGRVGSGGGTLHALNAARAALGSEGSLGILGGKRVLIIHAGGESRRLPAYVPEGKLFAPLPSASSCIAQPVILDHMLSLFLNYPWREDELVVCSGDVVIDFSTDSLDLPDAPICGFAAPDSFERGSRHGVFAFDPLTSAVTDYFQKASPELLEQRARIEGSEHCALDLGIVSFRGIALEALAKLAGREKSGLRFDLYLELMTACLSGLELEAYLERVGGSSSLSRDALAELYALFQPCGLSGVLVRSPLFLHFGSAAEYPDACLSLRSAGHAPFYGFPNEELVPELTETLILFASDDAKLEAEGEPSYVENCRNLRAKLAGGNMLVGLRDFSLEEAIPPGFCLEERRLTLSAAEGAKAYRLVYHRDDSFKRVVSLREARFCGKAMSDWLSERGLKLSDLGLGEGAFDLYAARLFRSDCSPSFLCGYWRLPDDLAAWRKEFLSSARLSIAAANESSDAAARDEERSLLRMTQLSGSLATRGFFAMPAADLARIVRSGFDAAPLCLRYEKTEDPLLKWYRGAALAAAGVGCIETAQRVGVEFAQRGGKGSLKVSVKADQIVWARSPARLDLAGGWTDTPPYTNRYGGAVVNLAVDLNGQSPIQAFARRTVEPRLRVHSIDLGLTLTIEDTASLRDFHDLSSPFALPKAALVLLGLGDGLPDGSSLAPALAAAGGGLELTLLCAIPKGSGLGTSSILAGTILGALERFFGLATTPEALFLQVLEIEQMLTTGGGWQDQIGGLTGGVKYIESRPGLKPKPVIHQLDPWAFEEPAGAERMTLFYTGVTRLAKHILKDVVDRVNGMERSYLFTHNRLAALAREASDAISLRDLDRLSGLLEESFRENKLIHASTTNAGVDSLMSAARPYCGGMKLLGAGGGGFALFMSGDRRQAEALREILVRDFEDERARLVDFSLNKKGLQVTVS